MQTRISQLRQQWWKLGRPTRVLSIVFLAALENRGSAQQIPALDYDSRLEQATDQYAARRYALAAQLFETLTVEEPERKEAFLWLGHARSRLAQWTEACYAYQNYVTLAPHDTEGVRGVARTYAKQGRHDLAQTWYQRALKFEPANQDLRREYAELDPQAMPVQSHGRAEATQSGDDARAAMPFSVVSLSAWRFGLAGVFGVHAAWWGVAIVLGFYLLIVMRVIIHVVGAVRLSGVGVPTLTLFGALLMGLGLWHIFVWGCQGSWSLAALLPASLTAASVGVAASRQ